MDVVYQILCPSKPGQIKSLILNREDVVDKIELQLDELELCIKDTVKFIEDKLCLSDILLEEYLPILIDESTYQLKLILEEMGDGSLNYHFSEVSIENINNFFIKTIFYQIKYLKKSHPLALLIWVVVLFRIGKLLYSNFRREISNYINSHWREIALHWICGAFKVKEIFIYQAGLASHLVDSVKENVELMFRINDLESHFSESTSGINFMIKAERIISSVLEGRNESSLFKKLGEVTGSSHPLVNGIFIEQYHVSLRFVEIITPLLNKRLSDPLRIRMFKYYEEEYGHEEFELKTCLSLGINKIQLEEAYPLPLMQAYVDAFTVIADTDPVGFFSSAMITEGMIGKPSPLYDYLEKIMVDNIDYQRVARMHDNLNVDLHHSYLSRLFMHDIEAITPIAQQRAMRNVLYLLELNYRSVEQMTGYYSVQNELIFYHGQEIKVI